MNLSGIRPPAGRSKAAQARRARHGLGPRQDLRRAATRGSAPAPASARSADSRAARCRCTAACRSAASPTFSRSSSPSSISGRLEKLEGDTFNVDRLIELGAITKARRWSEDPRHGPVDAQDYGGSPPVFEIGSGEDPEGRRHGAGDRRCQRVAPGIEGNHEVF